MVPGHLSASAMPQSRWVTPFRSCGTWGSGGRVPYRRSKGTQPRPASDRGQGHFRPEARPLWRRQAGRAWAAPLHSTARAFGHHFPGCRGVFCRSERAPGAECSLKEPPLTAAGSAGLFLQPGGFQAPRISSCAIHLIGFHTPGEFLPAAGPGPKAPSKEQGRISAFACWAGTQGTSGDTPAPLQEAGMRVDCGQLALLRWNPSSAVDQLPNFGIADQLPGLHSSRLQNGQNDVGLSRRVHEISHIWPQRGAWRRTSVRGLRGRCDVALNSMRNAGLTAVNGPRPRDQLPGGA